jgi:hypothetical protein
VRFRHICIPVSRATQRRRPQDLRANRESGLSFVYRRFDRRTQLSQNPSSTSSNATFRPRAAIDKATRTICHEDATVTRHSRTSKWPDTRAQAIARATIDGSFYNSRAAETLQRSVRASGLYSATIERTAVCAYRVAAAAALFGLQHGMENVLATRFVRWSRDALQPNPEAHPPAESCEGWPSRASKANR